MKKYIFAILALSIIYGCNPIKSKLDTSINEAVAIAINAFPEDKMGDISNFSIVINDSDKDYWFIVFMKTNPCKGILTKTSGKKYLKVDLSGGCTIVINKKTKGMKIIYNKF